MSQRDIEDLQIRLTHQELAIDELNSTVARQDQVITELTQQLVRIRAMVDELRPSPLGEDPAAEPPPPHY
jgi:SlyX protein